jgi:hypothetical protein
MGGAKDIQKEMLPIWAKYMEAKDIHKEILPI